MPKKNLILIDDFLPIYHVTEHHETDVRAPVKEVYTALRSFDLSDSTMIRWLFRLRGLPQYSLSLDGLLKMGFTVLGEIPQQELLLGMVGRFWTLSGDIQRVDADSFRKFGKKGYAKAAWNFTLSQENDGITLVATETRVYCLDNASRSRFRLYWLLIGPFSAWLRKETLRIIKRHAEKISKNV
jgi:hypothetical protein